MFVNSEFQIYIGTRDGQGAGDHDQPYQFGRRPSSHVPFPFSMRQFARLLILRGRACDGHFAQDGGPIGTRRVRRQAAELPA